MHNLKLYSYEHLNLILRVYVLRRFNVVCCIGRQPLYLSAYSYLITVQRVLTSYVQKGSNNDHLPFTREKLSTVQCNIEM